MKTSHFLIIFFLTILFAQSIFAQLDSFDLAKYKNPYYKRQQLDFNVNLGGNSSQNKYMQNEKNTNNNNSNFTGGLLIDFSKVLNSKKFQQEVTVNLKEQPNLGKSNYEISDTIDKTKVTTKNQSFENLFNLNISSTNRFYFKGLTFFELGINGTYEKENYKYQDSRDTVSQLSSKYKNINNGNNSTLNGSLDLRIGRGRIEYIEDARLAVYILDDLKKRHKLNHDPTEQEILDFSKIITEVKNKRFFDSRIRKIEEIIKVDSFLRTNNLVTANDATYFTTVNDNWDNASGPERTSGLRYSIGVSPWAKREVDNYHYINIINSLTDRDNEYKNKQNYLGISGDFQLDYNKPLNLYWQLTSGVNVRYRIERGKLNEVDTLKENENQFSSNVFIKLGYYPSSRTYVEATYSMYYIRERYLLTNVSWDSEETRHFNYFSPNFSLNGYYYISQRLRLTLHYSINYDYTDNDHEMSYDITPYYKYNMKSFYQNFSISLTYMLF